MRYRVWCYIRHMGKYELLNIPELEPVERCELLDTWESPVLPDPIVIDEWLGCALLEWISPQGWRRS